MPEISHLSRAPIIEALIHFQSNAAEHWVPENVRNELQPAWPEHVEVQEMRPVKFEFKQEAGKEPEQKITFPGVDGFIFRAPATQTVYHARRDGLIVSWLAPYVNWATFRDSAMEAWGKFRQILAPEELHSVTLRHINRLEFPMADFRLADFFTAPPAKPQELNDWQFHGFQHQTLFAVPNSGCAVQVVFTPMFDVAAEKVAFILDIEVRLKEPLVERTVEEVLEEMRVLKNKAFFSMLTPAALAQYQ